MGKPATKWCPGKELEPVNHLVIGNQHEAELAFPCLRGGTPGSVGASLGVFHPPQGRKALALIEHTGRNVSAFVSAMWLAL